MTLRFADRVDREFLRIKDPSGSGETLYFGILPAHHSNVPYVYSIGEIFSFSFFSPSRMWVVPTLRADDGDESESPTGPNMESWEEFEALMEDGLRKYPQSTGNCYPESKFFITIPHSLTKPPSGFGSDVVDARIFSASLKGENLLIDYEVAGYRLKGRLEIDLRVRPWKVVRAWKNGVPIDLEGDAREKNRRAVMTDEVKMKESGDSIEALIRESRIEK